MSTNAAYWKKKIAKYAGEEWSDRPSLFAETVAKLVPPPGDLLELGSGYGNDGDYFDHLGYYVLQSDIKDFRGSKAKSLPWKAIDMAQPIQFVNKYFDIVYAHLSIHYFTKERTEQLIKEIHAITAHRGYFAFLVNSDQDEEFGSGKQIENGLFEIGGIQKRFFSLQYAKSITKDYFDIVLLNQNGTSYKDRAYGNNHLIQFIGRKKS